MTPWVTRLLLANVAVFAAGRLAPGLDHPLAFVPAAVLIRPWTLFTYQFVHAGLSHLLFNMLALYFLGPRVEERLGPTRFITLYLLSGMTGGLLSIPFMPYATIVGASGSVYGVLLAFARFWPRERLYIWGVLPVEAWLLVVGFTVLSLVSGFGGGGRTAHFAHLGGFLGGWLYLVYLERRSPARKFKAKAVQTLARGTPSRTDLARWSAVDRGALHEVNRDEFNRVMAKVQEGGTGSLTEEERAFLDRFS